MNDKKNSKIQVLQKKIQNDVYLFKPKINHDSIYDKVKERQDFCDS